MLSTKTKQNIVIVTKTIWVIVITILPIYLTYKQYQLSKKQDELYSLLNRPKVLVTRLEQFPKINKYAHKILIKNFGKLPAEDFILEIISYKKDRYSNSYIENFSVKEPSFTYLAPDQDLYSKVANQYKNISIDFDKYDLTEKLKFCYSQPGKANFYYYEIDTKWDETSEVWVIEKTYKEEIRKKCN